MPATPPVPVVRAATWVSQKLRRLADAPLPPEIALFEMANAADVTAVVKALCDLGVGDALKDEALTVTELAGRIGAHEDSLHRLVRVAVALDLLHRKGDRHRLTRKGQGLRTDADFTIVPWMQYATEPVARAAWHGMADAIRTGRPAVPMVHGRSTWEWFVENPEIGAGFDRTMRSLADFNGPELAGMRSWPKGATVCDVAGGIGTLLSHVLPTDPSLRGILLDQAQVLEAAPEFLASRNVADRVRIVPGDMFEPLGVEADLFLLKDVLHDWDDTACEGILRQVAAAMRPRDTVVLVEIIQEPDRANALVPMVDLTMFTQTDGGRQRTVAEFDRLFEAAGLKRTAVRAGVVHSMVEAALV